MLGTPSIVYNTLGITAAIRHWTIKWVTDAAEVATRWLGIRRRVPWVGRPHLDTSQSLSARMTDVERPKTPDNPRKHHL